MQATRRSPIRRVGALLALCTLMACGGDGPTAPETLAGTYTATTLQVTPDGEAAINVLAHGGTLTLTLSANNAVSGTLFIPASITGGEDMNASMDGTLTRAGSTVEIQQAADTFVRDLTWSIGANTLSVLNERAGLATFTITLTRQ